LPELLGGVEGEALQVELSAVRILFELLGFLLNGKFKTLNTGATGKHRVGRLLTEGAISDYNVRGFNFLIMMRRERWNARPAQCGRAD
jgi:hypothetical protein